MSRDPRIPADITDRVNTTHKALDKKLDEHFDAVCRRKKSLYVIYILGDLALIGFAYTQGHVLLVLFTAISLLAVALHFYLFMCLPVSPGRKKRVFGVARMMHYDQRQRYQDFNLPPMRRFALLTQHPLMQQWHLVTMIDIVLPLVLSVVIASAYFLLSLEKALFLLVFVLFRLLVAAWQYRTLSNFYNDAVSNSYADVLASKSLEKTYAVSRANELTNRMLAHASDHLNRTGQYNTRIPSDADNSHAIATRTKNLPATFSGVPVNSGVLSEEPVPLSNGRNKLQRL